MRDPVPDFEQLFAVDGGYEIVHKKLLVLATSKLASARISAGNVGELARLSGEDVVSLALERLLNEGDKEKGTYYALRDYIRNHIRTLEKSPKVQFETTAGSNQEEWSNYWEAVDDKIELDPAMATERREIEEASAEIFDKLKKQFCDQKDELDIIDAFQNQFYKRKEVCELTGMAPEIFDRSFKRIKRAAISLSKEKEALKHAK